MKPAKHEVLLALLARSPSASAFIHIDPRKEGVEVPEKFRRQAQVVLQIGRNMPVPIENLEIRPHAWSGVLSFKGTPHFVYVPFTSVFAIIGEDAKGMVWGPDVPEEIAAAMEKKAAPAEPAPVLDGREKFAEAREVGKMERKLAPSATLAPVISLADRRAKKT